jgi:hypothetical protein
MAKIVKDKSSFLTICTSFYNYRFINRLEKICIRIFNKLKVKQFFKVYAISGLIDLEQYKN